MATIRFKRGTRSQLDIAASNDGLIVGEPYFITDEGRVVMGSASNAYTDVHQPLVLDAGTPVPGDTPSGTVFFRRP